MAKRISKAKPGLNRAQVDEFELIYSQLERFHSELQSLAKGKGNDALNVFKLSLLNNLLMRAHALLGPSYEAMAGFEKFDSEQLPSTSDALLVVSQYLGALEKLRDDNIRQDDDYLVQWFWVIDGDQSDVRTAPPGKLGKR